MDSVPSVDPKVVENIVDRLKKRGLFDKFRKECLIDIDTTPAYQNVVRRVQDFVAEHLRNTRWHPTANKNQLREILRKNLQGSQVLSSGVHSIVDQVVKPNVFKKDIEKVVCEYLGIDFEEREQWLKRREELQQLKIKLEHKRQLEEQQKEWQEQHKNEEQYVEEEEVYMDQEGQDYYQGGPGPNVPNLMEMPPRYQGPMGPPGIGPNMPIPGMPPTMPLGPMPPGMPPPPGIGPAMGPPGVGPMPGMPPPGMMGMPQVPQPMAGQFNYPGANVPGVPGVPNQMPEGMTPLQQQIWMKAFGGGIPGMSSGPTQQNQPGFPGTSWSSSQTTSAPPMGMNPLLQQAILQMPAAEAEEERKRREKAKKDREEKEKKKKEALEPLTVEDLLNVGVSKEVKNMDRSKEALLRAKMKEEKRLREGGGVVDEDDKEDGELENDGSRPTSDGEQVVVEEDILMEEETEDDSKPAKVYQFAWQNDDSDAAVSDMTISSVHTSDLSSFEPSAGSADEMSSDEGTAEEEKTGVKPEGVEKMEESQDETKAGDAVIDKEVKVVLTDFKIEGPAEPVKEKPRRLLALQYNYSDSEDEETREERKARISPNTIRRIQAKEREQRQRLRAQRRAELDAKRKEREEKNAKLRAERAAKKAKEKQDEAAEKDENQEESSEAVTGAETSELDTSQASIVTQDSATTADVKSPAPETAEEGKEEVPPTTPERPAPKSPLKSPAKLSPQKSPRKRPSKPTKEELKEQLREQKVMEKKMALRSRRQRKVNSKYVSDDFESIFTERGRQILSAGFEEVVEEAVVMDDQLNQNDQPDYTQGITLDETKSPATPTQDEQFVYGVTEAEVVMTTEEPAEGNIPVYEVAVSSPPPAGEGTSSRSRHKRRRSGDRPGTPYSDVSDTSRESLDDSSRPTRPSRRRNDSSPDRDSSRDGSRRRRRRSDRGASPQSPSDSSGSRSPTPDRRRSRRQTPPSDNRSPSPSDRLDRSTGSATTPPTAAQRYEASDLYKPFNPSSRAARYQARGAPEDPGEHGAEGDASSQGTGEGSAEDRRAAEEEAERAERARKPISMDADEVNFGMAAKKSKKPIDEVNFGMAARRTETRELRGALAMQMRGRGAIRGIPPGPAGARPPFGGPPGSPRGRGFVPRGGRGESRPPFYPRGSPRGRGAEGRGGEGRGGESRGRGDDWNSRSRRDFDFCPERGARGASPGGHERSRSPSKGRERTVTPTGSDEGEIRDDGMSPISDGGLEDTQGASPISSGSLTPEGSPQPPREYDEPRERERHSPEEEGEIGAEHPDGGHRGRSPHSPSRGSGRGGHHQGLRRGGGGRAGRGGESGGRQESPSASHHPPLPPGDAPMTRAARRQSEEDMLPPAKRLRHSKF